MADPFVAEIRLMPYNFAPKNWAFCNGQLLPISQNTALFSLLGTTYGGDGRTTFALPDLQSRVAMHYGQAPGLSDYSIGQIGGEETHVLLATEMPLHTHALNAQDDDGAVADPANNFLADSAGMAYSDAPPNTSLSPASTGVVGGGVPHNNLMPYLTLNYCIALQGVFPARN